MMAMGKLWDEAANTAEASDTSFLSKNSAVEQTQDLAQTWEYDTNTGYYQHYAAPKYSWIAGSADNPKILPLIKRYVNG